MQRRSENPVTGQDWFFVHTNKFPTAASPTSTRALRAANETDSKSSRAAHDNLPNRLKIKIKASLSSGHLDIARAAESLGTSVRTLQRKLSELGLSYSMLVDQARHEVATQFLLTTDKKIIDLAYELGYQDPSHFARAFRRVAGESPREYRASGCAELFNTECLAKAG